MAEHRLDGGLRRGGGARAAAANGSCGDQQHGCNNEGDRQKLVHYFASRRIGSATGAGKGTVAATLRRSGIRITAKSAKRLASIGSVPQSTPCHAGGGKAPASMRCAGGTSSFTHRVTLPLS